MSESRPTRSELGVLGLILRRGRREEVGGELGGLGHVALDFHLTLHEGDLRVELAEADCLEVAVRHREGRIGLGRLASLAHTLAVLKVNLVDESGLSSLLGGDIEGED